MITTKINHWPGLRDITNTARIKRRGQKIGVGHRRKNNNKHKSNYISTFFNILVDAMIKIKKWYVDVMDDTMFANTDLYDTVVGTKSSLLYVDNGTVGSLDPNWLQAANHYLCDLFHNCVGLKPNTKEKLKL